MRVAGKGPKAAFMGRNLVVSAVFDAFMVRNFVVSAVFDAFTASYAKLRCQGPKLNYGA